MTKVWVVTYINSKNSEPIITVFDNITAAQAFYIYCIDHYIDAYIDNCEVFHKFINNNITYSEDLI